MFERSGEITPPCGVPATVAETTPSPVQYFVGATLTLGDRAAGATGSLSLELPDASLAPLPSGQAHFAALEPGVYSLNSASRPIRFAVNLDPAESRTAPLPADELERLGVPGTVSVPLARTEAERKVRLQNADLEARQKLWRWFIVATLAVLGLETWLAGRTARRAVLREETL